MCTCYASFRVKAKGVIYERVHTDIGVYMRVHIIQRYDDTMKETQVCGPDADKNVLKG